MPNPWKRNAPIVFFLAVCLFFFTGLTAWMAGVWKFDFFNPAGDVFTYWKESLTWGLPFHPHHPPGYPWLIAVWHVLAGSILTPLQIMQSLSFLFLVGGALLMILVCKREGIAQRGVGMAFLFAGWPFVGSLYAVFPQIDAAVLFLLILGVVLALDGRWIASGAALGVATLLHPVAWIFAPVLIIAPWAAWLGWRKRPASDATDINPKRLALMTALAAAPMALLWIWQTIVTRDPLWTITSMLQAQVVSQGALPVLDGWFGTVAGHGLSGWAKAGILALVVLAALYILVRVLRERIPPGNGRELYRRMVCILIPAAVLGLAVVLNQHEIWAVVRFSKILILPLILYRERLFGFIPQRLRMPALGLLIGAGFLAQIAYAWYMANVFFSG